MSSNRTTLIIGGAILFLCLCVAVISIAGGAYLAFNQPGYSLFPLGGASAPTSALPTVPRALIPPTNVTCDDVEQYEDQGYEHIRPGQPHPSYNSSPPTSGWHWAQPQDWGIYSTPQVQEQLVHDLEHGGIVIQYNNLSPAELAMLNDFVKRDPHHMLVAPYPGLGRNVRVIYEAWTYLQSCNGVDLDALSDFINAYRDDGPESVP